MASSDKRIFRFGLFEADTSTGQLRKAGVRLRLQEQPFQVLALFLERPGEVISREEIQKKLWPSGTFVDFDHSLNTAINKIREALNDSASNPQFVETLAKRGYRFIAPVSSGTIIAGEEQENLARKGSAPEDSSEPVFRLTRVEEVPVVRQVYVRGLFLSLQIMYLVFYIVTLARLPEAEDVLERLLGTHPAPIVMAVLSASIGIPLRLYMISAIAFDVRDLSDKFMKLFPGVLVLDELWALAPFLLVRQIGLGMALGITAALAYVPFAQRTLMLMRQRTDAGSAIPDPH
ncbi:MAG TPA: winged helix-turn-helix domain-containing protein [Candidatus Sulfotelmatobacter sp.]|jgi:DNA-binding winged helix-turn-helix (wHTH) protein